MRRLLVEQHIQPLEVLREEDQRLHHHVRYVRILGVGVAGDEQRVDGERAGLGERRVGARLEYVLDAHDGIAVVAAARRAEEQVARAQLFGQHELDAFVGGGGLACGVARRRPDARNQMIGRDGDRLVRRRLDPYVLGDDARVLVQIGHELGERPPVRLRVERLDHVASLQRRYELEAAVECLHQRVASKTDYTKRRNVIVASNTC